MAPPGMPKVATSTAPLPLFMYRCSTSPSLSVALTLMVGVASLVRLSAAGSLKPRSLAASSIGAGGANGAIVSVTTKYSTDSSPRLPATSRTMTVKLCTASASGGVVNAQVEPVTTAIPISVPAS